MNLTEITKNINITDKVNKFIELSEDITNNIKQITASRINLPSKFIKNTKVLLENARRINILNIIKKKYFGDAINLDFEDDEPDVKSEFNTRFQKYTNFTKIIKEYIKPKFESTNVDLQKQFNEYTQGIDSNTLVKTIKTIIGIKSDSAITDDTKNILKIGINTIESSDDKDSTSAIYEIYLQMDVIKGELNQTTLSDIKCRYKDEYLGDMFQNEIIYSKGTNKYEINKKRLFFDIETQGNKNIQKAQEEEVKKMEIENKSIHKIEPKKETDLQPNLEPKKVKFSNGGKSKKRKFKNYKHKKRALTRRKK